jgi:ATP/ADP translocase
LKIRPGEFRRTGWMFLLLLCLVGSFITGRIIRDSLFLDVPNVKAKLPLMYVAIAFAVAALTAIVQRANRYMSRTSFMLVGNGVMIATLVGARVIIDRHFVWFPYAFYIWVDAFGSIMVLQYWTFAQEIFNSREAKRLFAVIGGGGVIANIIVGLWVGQAAKLLGVNNLLFVFIGALLLGIVALLFARRAAPVLQEPPLSREQRKAPALGSRYLLLIAATTLCTYLVTTLGDYEFKLIVQESIASRDARAAYFGTFYGLTGLLSAFIQFFLTSRILEKAGILPALLLLPLALAGGGIAIVLAPVLAAASFLKGSETTLRYTINDATSQLLYLPIAKEARARAKAFIEGILKPAAMGVAGVALFGLAHVLTHQRVGSAIAAIALVWVGLLILLRGEYLKTLLLTLKQRRLDFEGVSYHTNDEATLQAFRATLESGTPEEIVTVLDLLAGAGTSLQQAEALVLPLLQHADEDVKVAALDYLGQKGRPELTNRVSRLFDKQSEPVRAAAITAFCRLARDDAAIVLERFLDDPSLLIQGATVAGLIKNGGLDGVLTAADQLKSMIDDPAPAIRERAAWVLGEIGATGFYRPLIGLVQDASMDVQRTAIAACAKLKSPRLLEPLLELLRNEKSAPPLIIDALASYGPALEKQMLMIYADTFQPVRFREHLCRVLQRIGGPDSLSLLLSEMRMGSERLRTQALFAAVRITQAMRMAKAFRGATIGGGMPERSLLEICLRREIEGYLQALIIEREVGPISDLITTELRARAEDALARVFFALTFLYPGKTLDIAQANLTSLDPSVRANAVEVIDNVLQAEHKALVLPLMDDHLLQKTLMDGLEGIDVVRHSRAEWLNEMLSDADSWMVVATLHAIGVLQMRELEAQVVRCLEHEAAWVRETALWALRSMGDPGKVVMQAGKLIGDNVERVRRFGEHVLAELSMISNVEKVLFLKKIDLFRRIRGDDLARIAEIAEEYSYDQGDRIFNEGDMGDALYLIVSGKVKIHKGETQLAELGERQCFGEIAILDAEPRSASVTSLAPLLALRIKREDFGEIMQQKPEIAQGVIKVLCGRLRSANKR